MRKEQAERGRVILPIPGPMNKDNDMSSNTLAQRIERVRRRLSEQKTAVLENADVPSEAVRAAYETDGMPEPDRSALFAWNLMEALGGEDERTVIMSTDTVRRDLGLDGEGADLRLDVETLQAEGHVPPDLPTDEMALVTLPLLHWLYHDGRHYDPYCPDGCEMILDLPSLRMAITRELDAGAKP